MIGTSPTGVKKWFTGAAVTIQPELLEPAERTVVVGSSGPEPGGARSGPAAKTKVSLN
jgi:hypothetical protein